MDTPERRGLKIRHQSESTIFVPSVEQKMYLEDTARASFSYANDVCARAFSAIGFSYVPPELVLVHQEDDVDDECVEYEPRAGGRGSIRINPLVSTIKSGPHLTSVVFHEMIHHVQNQLGILTFDEEGSWKEDQADFLSGVLYTLSQKGRVDRETIRSVATALFSAQRKSGAQTKGVQNPRYSAVAQRATLFMEGATTGSLADGFTRFTPSRVPRQLLKRLSEIPTQVHMQKQ